MFLFATFWEGYTGWKKRVGKVRALQRIVVAELTFTIDEKSKCKVI